MRLDNLRRDHAAAYASTPHAGPGNDTASGDRAASAADSAPDNDSHPVPRGPGELAGLLRFD